MTRSRGLREQHRKRTTPEYGVWCSMRNRCYRPTNSQFKYYGGRGITVCDRWRQSFSAFFADMGPRPTSAHSIERRDNNGNYTPENCFWATRSQQQRNRRDRPLIDIDGTKRLICEWAEISGIAASTIHNRLREGWDAKRAVFEIPNPRRVAAGRRAHA